MRSVAVLTVVQLGELKLTYLGGTLEILKGFRAITWASSAPLGVRVDAWAGR